MEARMITGIRAFCSAGALIAAFAIVAPSGTMATTRRPVRTVTTTRTTRGTYQSSLPTPRASARARERADVRSAVMRSAYYDTDVTGAIARCNDGTYYHYSYRNTACVGHGGVALWYAANAYYNRDATGAIARCFDGTFYHSISRQGACLRHGGVDFWM